VPQPALAADRVPAILAAFDLGPDGRLSDGPVATGRLGAVWRLDTETGSWAVKQVGEVGPEQLAGILEGAAFEEAAAAAGICTPTVRRSANRQLLADVGGVRVRVQGWVELEPPALDLDAAALGTLVAGLHRVPFPGSVPLDAWYTDGVGERAWRDWVRRLRTRQAPFAEELAALVPDLIALEPLLERPGRSLRTCHRDLWADNVRRTPSGELCVFDFDNAGLADQAEELACVVYEYAGDDPQRAREIRDAYADAGGSGRLAEPREFAMAIAQLTHILEEGCRRWLDATTEADRADNEAWVREFLDRPLTVEVIEALLEG
jgi:Ser/Thr protein kinase RdoA (MazF antagonist)